MKFLQDTNIIFTLFLLDLKYNNDFERLKIGIKVSGK